MVENASKQSREQAMKRSARAPTSTPERNDDSRRATFKRTTETPVRKTLAMPTSGGKAGPENPGSAAGAAALNPGAGQGPCPCRRPSVVTEGYVRWPPLLPTLLLDRVYTPARSVSTDF